MIVEPCRDPERILVGVVMAADEYREAKEAAADAKLVLSACVLEARRAGVPAKLLARAVGVTVQMITKHAKTALDAEGLGRRPRCCIRVIGPHRAPARNQTPATAPPTLF